MNKYMVRYRITNHFRFIAFVVICIVLLTCIVNMVLGLNSAQSLTETTYFDYEISSGDTLWNIADSYMPADIDIREAIHTLCNVNNIKADDLRPGMIIQIPIYH